MTTLSEFQATHKTFNIDADQPAEHQPELAIALISTGWADFDLLDEENASAVHFYEFTHSEHEDGIGVYIIVRDGKGRYLNAWTQGFFGFETLEAAETDLLNELNG